jgi:hypothetical protein
MGIDWVFDVRGELVVGAKGLGRTIRAVFGGLSIGADGILLLVLGSGSFSFCLVCIIGKYVQLGLGIA